MLSALNLDETTLDDARDDDDAVRTTTRCEMTTRWGGALILQVDLSLGLVMAMAMASFSSHGNAV